jgi:NitT/TauT family transport system substrate-binding protein
MNGRQHDKRWRIGIASVLLVLAIGTVLVLSAGKNRPSGPPERVILGDAASALSTPVWVAASQGYFRAEGLDVTLRHFELGKEALAELLQGKVDVATVAATPIVLASFTRRDFVVFANISYVDNDCKIVARRDRGIRTAADLSGKSVGVSMGTSGEYFLDAFLAHYTVPRETLVIKDLNQSDMAEALAAGNLDAVAAFEPFGLEVRKRLGGNAVVITAPEVYRETFNLTAQRKFAEARPEALVRLLRAIARAEDFIEARPIEAQAIMAQRTGMSPADIATVMPDFTFALSLRQSLLPLLEDEARWAIRRGLVQGSAVPNYLDLIYPDALRAVNPDVVTIIH